MILAAQTNPTADPAKKPLNEKIGRATLPTVPLLLIALASCAAAAALWTAATVVAGHAAAVIVSGLYAAGVVALSAAISLVVIRPWKPRSLMTLPFVWMGGSLLRVVGVLGLSILLYFSLPFEPGPFLIAVVLAYLATLLGETWMYVRSIRLIPATGSAAGHDQASSGVTR